MLYIKNTFSKKITFLIILTKIFTTQKILNMENKHLEEYWLTLNSLLENKKKFDFRNTLNNFFFVKFISCTF